MEVQAAAPARAAGPPNPLPCPYFAYIVLHNKDTVNIFRIIQSFIYISLSFRIIYCFIFTFLQADDPEGAETWLDGLTFTVGAPAPS